MAQLLRCDVVWADLNPERGQAAPGLAVAGC
jgi:hypothetical protein